MTSKAISISIALAFLVGVVGWYGARYWTFGQFRSTALIPMILAGVLVVSYLRRDTSSRWLMLVISGGVSYASFHLYLYANSKEIEAGAYLVPGVAFAISAIGLLVSIGCELFQKRKTASNSKLEDKHR